MLRLYAALAKRGNPTNSAEANGRQVSIREAERLLKLCSLS